MQKEAIMFIEHDEFATIEYKGKTIAITIGEAHVEFAHDEDGNNVEIVHNADGSIIVLA